jgi:hypothetical protein
MNTSKTLGLKLVFLLIFSIQFISSSTAAISNNGITTKCQIAVERNAETNNNFRKRSLKFAKRTKQIFKEKIKKIRAVLEGEKASTLAKASLFLLLGSIGLRLLFYAAQAVSVAIGAILGIAFLASIALALIVLFGDENKKSRAIAKAVLWVAGLIVFITLLLIAFVFALLIGLG